MKSASLAAAYQESVIENAPPIKIVHMLYEGALRFLEQAEQLDPIEDLEAFTRSINRADAIISELRLSLDHECAPELTKSLDALYLFVEERIRTAFLDRKPEGIGEARSVLTTLLKGWKGVELDAEQSA